MGGGERAERDAQTSERSLFISWRRWSLEKRYGLKLIDTILTLRIEKFENDFLLMSLPYERIALYERRQGFIPQTDLHIF